MQRSSSKMLVILLTLSVFFSAVAAAPQEKKTLVLTEVRLVPGAGIVLLFDSTGMKYSDIESGIAHVHSIAYDMSCGFKDESQVVRCIIPASLKRYAGETFRVYLAGFLFWAKIPAGPLICAEDESLWYSVKIYEDGKFEGWQQWPAQVYDWWLEFIEEIPELSGITLEITDKYCGPIVIFEPVP